MGVEMLYNEEVPIDEEFEGVDDSSVEDITEFDEFDENTDYDNNYQYSDIEFEQDTPDTIATPDPIPDETFDEVDPVPDPEYETVEEIDEIIIQNYDEEYLQVLEDDGYTFYVVYEDGTEDEVDISEIEEPTTSIEFLDDEAYVLANSILEHFWDDDSGVHVTQDSKEDWEQLVEDNFPDLDATHPHHNIIVNSYGVLIRSALKNLVQLSRSALAFYDGLGNNSSNIISTFGRGGIQIGPTDQKHLIINSNGITVYNGDGTIAPLTASNISAVEANIRTLIAADATISGRLDAAEAVIDDLDVNYAHISNGVIDNAKIGYADVNGLTANYAQVNMANVNNAWIQNGTIKDGAIADAMIHSVSANKLTAGTIDASNITVTNLNADNITTGTINGQRIGAGTLSLDKLEEDVYTETEVDGIITNLQSQIDGAIETWTGTDVPTLNNAPASSWTTNSVKDTHVGDVYFVVNSQSQQNGYNYRFTKTTSGGTSTYSWQLIKDNDVTNALQRLTTAEGKIGTIEQFDSTVSSYMTNTDAEITSIKSAATTLAGRVDTAEGSLATKVDTSTFNTLSQTVDGHSSSITQLTTETTTLTGRVDDIDADIKVFNKQKETIITDTNVRSESPIDLTVFGFSRQITTTGKNLLDYADASWGTFRTSSSSGGTIVASGGNSRRYFAVPLAAGQSVTWHRNGVTKFSGYLKLCTSYPPVVGDTISGGVTLTNYTSYTLTNNSEEDACGVLFISSKPSVANLEIMQAQLEYGTAFTSYEYCSGGIPSPSQAWPREIRVVNQLTLHFRSKNLIDISDMERGSMSGGVNYNSTTSIRLKESKKIPVTHGVEYGIGGSIVNGSCGCYIAWNDNRGYCSSYTGWLESGAIIECPEGAYSARVFFRREDDINATVTLDEFSDLWFGPIVEYEEPIDSIVSIDLQGHELRSVYDIAEDHLIFEKQTGSTYSLSLVQETGVTTSATSDGLEVVVGQNALSTTGDLSDGATVIYCLPEPITYNLGTVTLPNLSSPNIYVYAETERYTYASSYGVEIPYLEMSYWAMSIRNLVAETIEKQIKTSAKINNVSDTVDEHTRKIGSLETTIVTKADGSEVTTISNKLNNVSDTVDGHSQTISSVQTTVDGLGTRVTAAESNITQNATNINLKVSKDGVISSINQSAESVKIDASKVEINGTAIFTNEDFREAADAAYASKASEELIETANSKAETALQTALDGAFLVLTSTNGQLFKNGSESTILQVAIFPNGGDRCDTITQVRNRFGASAYIEWKWLHESSGEWGTLLSTDPHLSQGGMWLTVGPNDVATKTTFAASLVVPD